MPRLPRALLPLSLLAALAATGCSGQKAKEDRGSGSGHERPAAPGMIPADCEALLNKSQEWKYVPGQKWQAENEEVLLEVARFFGTFRLVPVSTSEVIRGLRQSSASAANEARALLQRFSKNQVCDPYLAQTFLQALVGHRWSKEAKAEAGRLLHQFLLNQQALELPLHHRALQARLLAQAMGARLVPGSAGKARELGGWIQRSIEALPPFQEDASPTEEWRLLRSELELSHKVRERIGSILPLP